MLRKYRRRAEICLAGSRRTENAATAQRLRLMAGEYLCRADMIERREPAPKLVPQQHPHLAGSVSALLARLTPGRRRAMPQGR
jgi:hypothetical protein